MKEFIIIDNSEINIKRIDKFKSRASNHISNHIDIVDKFDLANIDSILKYTLCFIHDNNTEASIIKAYMADKEKRIIIFSGSFPDDTIDPNNPPLKIAINSITLYENISSFIEAYIKDGIPKWDILMKGKYYKYQEALLIRFNILNILRNQDTPIITDEIINLSKKLLEALNLGEDKIELSIQNLKKYNSIFKFKYKLELLITRIKLQTQ